MARKKATKTTFGEYVAMGAGFAAGAAVVSVIISGVSIGALEIYKKISGNKAGALGAGSTATPLGVEQSQSQLY
jgi:hypothetical protein